MPPRAADDIPFESTDKPDVLDNAKLMPDAGKVTIGTWHLLCSLLCCIMWCFDANAIGYRKLAHIADPALPWGKGFIADFQRTIGTHWKSEMINFNQKTVGVALLMFISVIAPNVDLWCCLRAQHW